MNSVIHLRNLHDVPASLTAHDATVPGTTGQRSEKRNRREGNAMYPGLSEVDCRVAEFRYQQMRVEGQQQQVAAAARPAATGTRLGSMALRQHAGALLVRAGQRLQVQGVQMVRRESLVPTATGEMGAIA